MKRNIDLYDFNELVSAVEKQYGFDFRDFESKAYKGKEYAIIHWARKNHPNDIERIIEVVDGYDKDYSISSPFREEYIKWNTEFMDSTEYKEFYYPDEENDCWLEFCDKFGIRNGCMITFCPKDLAEDEYYPEFFRKCMKYFVDYFEKNNIPDEIECKVIW